MIERELIVFTIALLASAGIVAGIGLGPAIWQQATQDPTFIIFTIFAIFVVAAIVIFRELIGLIREHRMVSAIMPRLGQFMALELEPAESQSVFGKVLTGIRTGFQINPMHSVEYAHEVSDAIALEEGRHSYVRFAARVCQYLGVLGTMLGLIIALGILYQDLSVEQSDLQHQIVDAIKHSMSGMYAAYATSVAGLFLGSILLTFGAILIQGSLDRLEIRISSLCRRVIMPQLDTASAQGGSDQAAQMMIKMLQGTLEQYQLLNAATQQQLQELANVGKQAQQLAGINSKLQKTIEGSARQLEIVAGFAARAMGLAAAKPRE